MYSIIYTPPKGFTRILQYSEFVILEHALRGMCAQIFEDIGDVEANTEYGFLSNEKHVFCFDLSDYSNDTRIIITVVGINEVEKIKMERIIKSYLEGSKNSGCEELLDIHSSPAFR